MPPSSTLSPDLFTRIDQWAQEMVTYTEQQTQRWTRSSGNSMTLRSLSARQGLTEISINPHSRKRKAAAAMDGRNEAGAGKKTRMDGEPPKQRGRPPGPKNNAKRANEDEGNGDEDYQPLSLPNRSRLPSSVPDLPPPSKSSAKSGSPSRNSTSPGKKGLLTLDKAKSEAAIDMAYLETCTPAVKQTSFQALRASKKKIPSAVLSMYNKLKNVPHGAIPLELEVVLSLFDATQLAIKLAD